MITNSIGILLYSLLYGRKIGEDKLGNKFFTHKKKSDKRWVLYKKVVDPTVLDVKWQIWLTNRNISKDSLEEISNFSWQKEKKANLTGTSSSYHPTKNHDNNSSISMQETIKTGDK